MNFINEDIKELKGDLWFSFKIIEVQFYSQKKKLNCNWLNLKLFL